MRACTNYIYILFHTIVISSPHIHQHNAYCSSHESEKEEGAEEV